MTSRLRTTIVPVDRLPDGTREQMFALFSRYYEQVDRPSFDRDLDNKRHVILLYDFGGVVGFSTLAPMTVKLDGKAHRVVFSGDTVLDRRYWGNGALQRAFLRYMLGELLRPRRGPLHWLLISKGYKTYLLLANNFPEHWPRADRPTPPRIQRLVDVLATRRFGSAYDARRGLVDFGFSRGQLRPGVADATVREARREPKIRFFLERNPSWTRGTELVCLGRFSWRTVAGFFVRILKKRLRPILAPARARHPLTSEAGT